MRQNVSRESRDIPLLSGIFFDKVNFLRNEGFPYEIFRYCEKITFWQNHDTPSYAIFLIQKFSETKGTSQEIFSVLWDKKISRENRDIPFLSIKFFDKKNFWKTKGSPTKLFGTVRKSFFDKIVIHHLMQFFNPEIFWNTSVPLLTFSVLSDKKASREILDITFLSIKLFVKRTFLKTEGVPYEIFRYCEKINVRQNLDTPSYALSLFQKFSGKKGPPRSSFGTVRQKSFEKKSWYPPPSHKNFR